MPLGRREDLLDQPIMKHAHREYTPILETQTIGEAIAALRAYPPGGQLFYLYVVDQFGHLAGVLPVRALLVHPPETPVASLMFHDVAAIPEEATVLEACEFFIQHRFLAMPVVDSHRTLLGVVDVNLFSDEMFDLAERRSRDDVFQLIGIHVWRSERLAPWSGFRDRFPWLIANMIGGGICAMLASAFEGVLNAVIALTLFMPIVLTLSESVSIQSMSILLQGLHGSRVDWRFLLRAIARELSVAVFLGGVSGVVIGMAAGGWLGNARVGVSVGISVLVALVSASLLGVLLPVLVRAARADPRVAAGPIVLATTDVMTLLFYFSISSRILVP